MPTLEANVRNAAVDGVAGALDSGELIIETSGDAELGDLSFGSPSFGAASAGTATAAAMGSEASASAGTADHGMLLTSGAADAITCSISGPGGGGDLVLTSVDIDAGDTIEVTEITMSIPAS